MLYFPLWKKALIWITCALGVMLASPNLWYERVERANDARALAEVGMPLGADAELWPGFLPSNLLNLGLDLRGGAHLLVEVQVEQVYEERMEGVWPEVLRNLRVLRDEVGTVRRQDAPVGELLVRIGNPDGMATALRAIRELAQPVPSITGVGASDILVQQVGDTDIRITLSDAEKTLTDDRTMAQSLEIVRRRVDESGTREPTIQRQGQDRILIQVPGVGSAQEVIDLLGTTAKLAFHHVVSRTADPNARPGTGNVLFPSQDEPGISYIVERRPVVTGEQLVDAQPTFQDNRPVVSFRFNATGGRAFGEYTAQNIGSPFAIVLDDEVISAPVIQSHIPGGSGIISGRFSPEETTRLAILLRAGALPAELVVLEQRSIGPELGQDSIEAGRLATLIAFVAVLVFMFFAYGTFGLFADIALILNLALIMGILSLIGATLTLPGIAGIVLTVGMAVDANVLVFERIREELKRSKGPARAIELGYEKAFSAIIDANITTFIAAVILFALGSGPVRGFAITLGIGIITSVFTAIYVTRLMIATWLEMRRPKTVEV
ncbi:MAG: protein translocase subunit SecD [Pseudomonadota bacterium]